MPLGAGQGRRPRPGASPRPRPLRWQQEEEEEEVQGSFLVPGGKMWEEVVCRGRCLLQRRAHCHLTVRRAGTWEPPLGHLVRPSVLIAVALRPGRGVPPMPAAFPSSFWVKLPATPVPAGAGPARLSPPRPQEASGQEAVGPGVPECASSVPRATGPGLGTGTASGPSPWAGGQAPAEQEPCPARLP